MKTSAGTAAKSECEEGVIGHAHVNGLGAEEVKLIAQISLVPDMIDTVPSYMRHEAFYCELVRGRPSIISRIPKEHRSKAVCDLAFSYDVQLISFIPDPHITEEMMYKAVQLNTWLLRQTRVKGASFLSERIADFVVQADWTSWFALPDDYKTPQRLLKVFEARKDFLKSEADIEGSLYPVAVKALLIALNDQKRYASLSVYHSASLSVAQCEIEQSGQSDECIAKSVKVLSDDESSGYQKAVAFIGLGLHEPQKAGSMIDSFPELSEVVIDYHGAEHLIKYSKSRHGRRLLAVSDFEL